jgi:hypothetical protein
MTPQGLPLFGAILRELAVVLCAAPLFPIQIRLHRDESDAFEVSAAFDHLFDAYRFTPVGVKVGAISSPEACRGD